MGGMVVNAIRGIGQRIFPINLTKGGKDISIMPIKDECEMPEVPEFGKDRGLPGMSHDANNFLSTLYDTYACLQSKLSEAFINPKTGIDIHNILSKQMILSAVIGQMYNFIKWITQSMKEFQKLLKDPHELATT